jgi:hypothetical protein
MARYSLQYRRRPTAVQDVANRYKICVSQLADIVRHQVTNSDLDSRFVMFSGNKGSAIALA